MDSCQGRDCYKRTKRRRILARAGHQRKADKIILFIILGLLAAILLAADVYICKCTHYWQPSCRATIKAGFGEKQEALPDGSIINYSEEPMVNLCIMH